MIVIPSAALSTFAGRSLSIGARTATRKTPLAIMPTIISSQTPSMRWSDIDTSLRDEPSYSRYLLLTHVPSRVGPTEAPLRVTGGPPRHRRGAHPAHRRQTRRSGSRYDEFV